MKPCPIPGCAVLVANRYPMCVRHWNLLPLWHKARIGDARIRGAGYAHSELRPAYRAAVAEAVAFLVRKMRRSADA